MIDPEYQGPQSHEQYQPKIDWVAVEKLPNIERFIAHGDQTKVFDFLVPDDHIMHPYNRPAELIEAIKPPEVIRNRHNIGIDLELLASAGRYQAGDRFRNIIRMGGSFEHRRHEMSPREFEVFAVETMGLDASLYFHGIEQARRMENGMAMQQELHQRVFSDLYAVFGSDRATVSAYNAFCHQIPNFTATDIKYGILCGFGHDYGEVKLEMDVPFELKTNKASSEFESGACVDLLNELHFPIDGELREALDHRVAAERTDIDFQSTERESVKGYLHPREITNSIFGTEQLHHGDVERGVFFVKLKERIEYVLSGIRGSEAIEYNFQNIRNDQVLTQNILRLDVSTFFNSLRQIMDLSNRFVAGYDFLRQNTQSLDYYISVIKADIEARRSTDGTTGEASFFGVDPFINYSEDPESDVITREQAKERFLLMAQAWEEWKGKDSLMKHLWETYFGTEHPLTKDNPDVSFMHKTARSLTEVEGSQVAVIKGLVDMFGVGLDQASQVEHEAKALALAA